MTADSARLVNGRLVWMSCAVHQHIRRAPEEVLAYVADASQYPHWLGLILDTRNAVPPQPGVEGRFTGLWRHLGRQVEIPYGTRLQDSTGTLVVQALSGPFDHAWTFTCAPGPEGTHLTVTLEGCMLGALERQLSTSVYALRTLLEEPATALTPLVPAPW